MFSKLKLLIACVCVAVASSAAYAQSDPNATLREAYAKGDAARAADAYHTDATYAEIYARIAPSVRAGMPAIRAGMEAFFRQLGVGPNDPADLNFRIVSRTTSDQLTRDTGYYRIAIGKGAKRQTFFGQFVTGWRDGKFQFDISGEANESDFEAAVGPLMFADEDEELSASYYDSLVGYFPKDASCGLLVTRSVRRLFLFDDCSGDWRGLSRVSGRVWTAGQKLIDPTPVDRYSFESDKLTRTGQLPQTLTKATPYLLEPVSFGDKVKLAGTVYQPTGATSRSAAIVLEIGRASCRERVLVAV